jgi:hypothetical protein
MALMIEYGESNKPLAESQKNINESWGKVSGIV